MTVIAAYARTPFVKFLGQFAQLSAPQLGAIAVREALVRAGLDPADPDALIAGQVLQAGVGQNPARQTAVAAGLPLTTPSLTLNAVCLSGMEAIVAAVRLIEAGEATIVVAVGQESMSQAPHAQKGSRAGTKYGAMQLIDTLEHDGLVDAFEQRSMGASTEQRNGELGIDRESQDAWAAQSHQRLAAAAAAQSEEIVPIDVTTGRTTTTVSADDGLRADTTAESLGKLRAAFSADGTITAGNSSQITDGAAAVIVMSDEEAAARGIRPLARIVSHALVAGPDVTLHAQPAAAILRALEKAGRNATELTSVEINEAFASVSVHSTQLLGVDAAIVNPHGGAIALGHPIGASGTRIVGHLARTLAAQGAGNLGAAGICGGGGQGSAIVLESL